MGRVEEAYDSARLNESDTAFARGLRGDALDSAVFCGVVVGADSYAESFGVEPAALRQYIVDRFGFASWSAVRENVEAFMRGQA